MSQDYETLIKCIKSFLSRGSGLWKYFLYQFSVQTSSYKPWYCESLRNRCLCRHVSQRLCFEYGRQFLYFMIICSWLGRGETFEYPGSSKGTLAEKISKRDAPEKLVLQTNQWIVRWLIYQIILSQYFSLQWIDHQLYE